MPGHTESDQLEPDCTFDMKQTLECYVMSSQATEWISNNKEESQNPVTPQNSLDSQNVFAHPGSEQNSLELSYEPTSQSSFDPYGFKLSPEHSSHTLLDPDEAELSPEPAENELPFEPSSFSQPDQLSFDHYVFDITSSQMVRDSDPYGFKLSPEEANQEVLGLCENQEPMDLCTHENNEQIEPSNYSNQEVLVPHTYENQEVLEHCSHNNQELLDLCNNGNQEVLEPSSLHNRELVFHVNQKLLDLCGYENQEVVEPYCNKELLEPYNYNNQEVLEPCSHGNQEVLGFAHSENQEVLDLDSNQEILDFSSTENQEVLVLGSHDNQDLQDVSSNENQDLLELGSHDNQEVLDLLSQEVFPEANNNQCIVEPELNVSSTNNSSESDVASEDLLGLELINATISAASTTNTNTADTCNMASSSSMLASHNLGSSTAPNLLEGDLSSVFGAGGYISCPDVADDLEPLERRQAKPVAEPEPKPVRPVRPPRPSLRVSGTTCGVHRLINIFKTVSLNWKLF